MEQNHAHNRAITAQQADNCRRLWRFVLLQAIRDLNPNRPNDPFAAAEAEDNCEEAHEFFLGPDLARVCEFAGIPAWQVRAAYDNGTLEACAATGWRMRA